MRASANQYYSQIEGGMHNYIGIDKAHSSDEDQLIEGILSLLRYI